MSLLGLHPKLGVNENFKDQELIKICEKAKRQKNSRNSNIRGHAQIKIKITKSKSKQNEMPRQSNKKGQSK
jgi:hypothetical protein